MLRKYLSLSMKPYRPNLFLVEKTYPSKGEAGEIDECHLRLDVYTGKQVSDDVMNKIFRFMEEVLAPQKVEPATEEKYHGKKEGELVLELHVNGADQVVPTLVYVKALANSKDRLEAIGDLPYDYYIIRPSGIRMNHGYDQAVVGGMDPEEAFKKFGTLPYCYADR